MEQMVLITALLLGLAFGYCIYCMTVTRQDIRSIKTLQVHSHVLLLGMKIRADAQMLDDMKRQIKACVENEDFENAKKLSELIRIHTDNLAEQIENFNSSFGKFANINLETFKHNAKDAE